MFGTIKERYKGLKEWGEIAKSYSHKYVNRYPKKSGKGYNYVYADSWKKPFGVLLACFGIGRKKIDADYESGNIKKDFGADKKTFAAHALEYFTNKVKWDNLFAKKEAREKYKKPVMQKDVTARLSAEKVKNLQAQKTAGAKQGELRQSEAMPVNRSLMRKIWSMYSADGKRIEAQESAAGQKAAAKDGVFTDKAESVAAISNGGDDGGNKKGGTVTQDLELLSGVLESGKSATIRHNEIGEILVDAGTTGKSGYGIKHIIEQRYAKDGKNEDEITALMPLVLDAAKSGRINRDNDKVVELEKNGIVAIISKQRFAKSEKWLLTGFDNFNKEQEATDAIQTVIASHSYAPEYSSFRKQVGAVIASLKQSIPENAEADNKNLDGKETAASEAEKRANRSNAMKGNQNAKKNGILNEEVTDGGKENNANAERAGISDGTQSLRAGRGEGTGGADASGGKVGDNGAQSVFSPDKSGAGFTDANGDVNRGRGRIGKVQAQKIRAQCREILKKPDDKITEAEKQILAQYVGAGGTGEDGASNSGVLYEFYTPRSVVSKVWQLVDKYNPRQDKSVIEPSGGIGRFAEGRAEKITLFELEQESARIAHILHPDAEVVQGAFQEHFLKNKNGRFAKDFKKFDVAVGNPPYGAYTGKYKGLGEGKDFKRYDSYFMARTLDTLADGGIMAMVVPSGFLDGKSSYGKDLEKIAGKAKLLEAWRLPNGTFDSTDVGTDIVVFRKGDGGSVEELKNYFKNNPERIAGIVSTRIDRFGKEETYVKPKEGETFESAIANIDVSKSETEQAVKLQAETIGVKSETKEASPVTAKTVFGDTVKTKSGTGIVRGYVKKDGKTAGVVVNVNGKREEVLFSDEQAQARSRSEAMKSNQNAKGEHDYPQNPAAHIIDVEEFNKKYGKTVDALDMPIWKATDKFGNVDMTKLSAEQQKYVEKSPHFVKDGGVYVNAVNYASGNIRQKLRLLDVNDAQYELKKSLLEAVCPKTKKIGEFTLSPITDWAREYVMQDGGNLIDGFFAWAYNGYGYFSAGSSPISAEEIPAEISFSDIEAFIEKKPLKLARNEADADDPKLKARYKERKKQLRRDTAITLFNRYLAEGLSLDEQKALTQSWNDKSNSFVNPDFSKVPVFVDGMSSHFGSKEFELRDVQMKGISMLVNKGTGLLAYDVGVGKTACGIVATVNQIQTGRAKRPLICVPKAVYSNWIASIHEHFPKIKVNELGNLSKNYWKEGMQIEDGSISVCTYEGLENIGFNASEEMEIQEDTEFGALERLDDGNKSKRDKANASEKAAELVGSMVKTRDEGVQFSELGFDHITVDEVHNFRNLFKMPRHIGKGGENKEGEANEFQGLGSVGKPSDRAKKLFAITQLIQRHNDGRNTFLLSATPFQNSPTEIYSILSYMARDKLKEMGYYSLEQFVSNFCKVQREYTVKANRITEAPVVKGFQNLSELQNLLTSYMDKVDGEEAGVKRPERRMHTPELELSDLQKAIMDDCSAYIEKQEGLPKEKRDDGYMFRAMNAMRNCALSPALVDDAFIPTGYKKPPLTEVVESSPKLKFVCDSIIAQYKRNAQNGQIMYMPLGVEQFPQVREYLVKRGVPKDAVALIAGPTTSDKQMEARDETFKEFNDPAGKCKIIIGSSTIKEGCNLQGNTTSIYCTQLEWNPTDVQQLWGRGWRQGNKQGVVHCITPLMHDSLDPMIFQKHGEKLSRQGDIYSFKGDRLNVEEVNPEELKFSLIKDPKKRADLQAMEFTEENKSNHKMYGQLIDVLHKQIEVAFKSDEDIAQEAHKGITLYDGIEGEKRSIEEKKELKAKLKELSAKLKKTYKGKEDSFDGEDVIDEYNAAGGWRASRYYHFEAFLQEIDIEIASAESDMALSKSKIAAYNKNLKKLREQRESCRAYLLSKGLRTTEDCEAKIQDYVKLMDDCRDNIARAKTMREQFYQKALEDDREREKEIPSVEDMIKMNVESIMTDLRPMETETSAASANAVKKSWCYFDGRGRLHFRKTARVG